MNQLTYSIYPAIFYSAPICIFMLSNIFILDGDESAYKAITISTLQATIVIQLLSLFLYAPALGSKCQWKAMPSAIAICVATPAPLYLIAWQMGHIEFSTILILMCCLTIAGNLIAVISTCIDWTFRNEGYRYFAISIIQLTSAIALWTHRQTIFGWLE